MSRHVHFNTLTESWYVHGLSLISPSSYRNPSIMSVETNNGYNY